MDSGDSNESPTPRKEPKIVKIGQTSPLSKNSRTPAAQTTPIWKFQGEEVSIDPKNWKFVPNQNSEITIHDDGLLEVTVMQDSSTPGVKLHRPIVMPEGSYVMTVVAHAGVPSTFFPWAMGADKVRLTPTVHIGTNDNLVSVPFTVEKEMEVWFGVLCHRQEIGDKCYIQSMHIDEEDRFHSDQNEENDDLNVVFQNQLVPHQSTVLNRTENGVEVRSKPISTPGAYAIVYVEPSSTITMFVRVSVAFPSVAFLYVADALTGQELVKRNVIFESSSKFKLGEISELYSSVEIPHLTSCIRVGVLFSTVSKPDEHFMTIHTLEICKHQSLNDFVDESYVLSLENESSKFDLCRRQADRFNFELSRWIAVDGNSEGPLGEWQKYLEGEWTDYDGKLGRKAIDKPGAWGYLLTMKEIFADALRKNHNSIAVFDDDFILANSFDHGFSRLIEKIGEKWQVIYLGASQWLWDNTKTSSLPHYPPDENTNGTFAVIYHSSTFKYILDQIELMEAPFDAGPLRSFVTGTGSDQSFVAYPNLVIANLEKTGIRDSRNQIEFSKRFAWDLKEFPPWFTSWQMHPKVVLDTGRATTSNSGKNFITAVTTVNRKKYLQNFIEDWISTRSQDENNTLIIADDGSIDGTIEWITSRLNIEGSRIVLIRNDGLGIARQSNSIFHFVSSNSLQFDALFMCNDDIRFLKSGWDEEYFSAMTSSGFDHLVYFNPEWKEPSHKEQHPQYPALFSSCTPREAMGCFYTLTPSLISELGYFDEEAFPVRGHSHIDYTLRACRAGANDADFLYDLGSSNQIIGMVTKDGYKRTYRTLSVHERSLISSDSSLKKRENILMDESRKFIPKGW